MKKIALILALSFLSLAGLSAQQITRFGVVDTARVYQAYFRNSAPVRNYENKKSQFQAEITKRSEEIQKLKSQKTEAESSGNDATASRLESEIIKKTDSLTEYTNAKNVELESIKNNLQNSDYFNKNIFIFHTFNSYLWLIIQIKKYILIIVNRQHLCVICLLFSDIFFLNTLI